MVWIATKSGEKTLKENVFLNKLAEEHEADIGGGMNSVKEKGRLVDWESDYRSEGEGRGRETESIWAWEDCEVTLVSWGSFKIIAVSVSSQ